MKNRHILILSILMVLLYPSTALANSSWHWLTETTPLTILPFAVVGTLIIEISAVIIFGRVKNRARAAIAVTLANLVSYLAAYFLQTIDTETGYSFMDMVMHQPIYIISVFYLLLTIIIELPAVYFLLQRGAEDKRRLLLSIVISNTLTTALVAVCEGIFAPGSW